MKRFLALAVVAAAAALALSSSASASPPTPVTVTVDTVFANGFGTFQISGVGQCLTGTTTDQTFVTGGQSGSHLLFHDLKTFTCDDGTGTFIVNVQAMLRFSNAADSFTWNIVSGTGAYTNLRGSGSGVGLELPGEVIDTFVGSVHLN